MNGFLNVYKPKGLTSFDVIRFLRKETGIRKIGHIGTLDPAAEGVMVFALNQATKLIEFMMGHYKTYEAEITLGKKSTTYDSEGELTDVCNQKVSIENIEKVVSEFVGEIEQTPPIFSAIKINGERAYKKARAGEAVEMKKRKVNVYSIKIISYDYPVLRLLIHCGSGTYIRSIAHDIGNKLKVGAYLSKLVRIAIDNFRIEESCRLDDIKENGFEKYLLPLKRGVYNMKSILLTQQEYDNLKYGRFIQKELLKGVDIYSAIFNNKLVGIVERVGSTRNIKFKKQIIYD